MTSQPQTHSSFEFVRQHRIDSLDLNIEHYVHKVTGAEHYHIGADLSENVFMVAIRTMPTDDRGVAHILEHTALCGSKKYPVRDPFFMMIRRSLNTFMNAFTSSDWTAYPFASENKKDFNNLLDVYLDAVFFANLNELDFLQEGHRLEFAEMDNKDSELLYKGVVFNEMKGAMSSATSQLWQTLTKHLYPQSTYHFNSGGEPVAIPDLSYEQLKEFYQHHYHPSNAVFMTFGDIDANVHQEKFEQQVLAQFEQGETFSVANEMRYQAPMRVQESYALDEEDTSNKTHIVLGWLLGESEDLDAQLEAHLLSSYLLDNSSSPLRRVLETTDLGLAPSPMCGLEDSNKEMVFACGVDASESARADDVEKLVLDTLQQVIDEGVDQQQLESVLHQLELGQREIGGDGYPYGLQLMLTCLGSAIHGGDPVAQLDLDPALEKLKQSIQDPNYIPDLINKLLLNNQHRVRVVLTPDNELSARKDQAEKDKLAGIKAKLSDEETQEIIEKAVALQQRQQQEDDASLLPEVTLDDVRPDIKSVSAAITQANYTAYQSGTNGLVYRQLVINLPLLTEQELSLMPYLCWFFSELGAGEFDYLDMQKAQAQFTGSFSAFHSYKSATDDEQNVDSNFIISGKALARNADALTDLMIHTLEHVRFDELERMRELISQARTRKEQSITGNGHSLAMMAASQGYSPLNLLQHETAGLLGVKSLKAMDEAIKDEAFLLDLAAQLSALRDKLISCEKHWLDISDQVNADVPANVEAVLKGNNEGAEFNLPAINEHNKEAWLVNTQVNFCAKAFKTVVVDHPDAAALTVLGGVLRNGYLHSAVREQGGAYGGGATHDATSGTFRFYSYRDPRLVETLNDFDQSIEWLLAGNATDAQLQEAILGVIGSMDKPGSPAGEAKGDFQNRLYGRTDEQRRVYRQRVLSCSLDDLMAVANTYLSNVEHSVVVVTSQTEKETCEKLGLELKEL